MAFTNNLISELRSLCDYLDTISTRSDEISLIERDIVLEKLRSIYVCASTFSTTSVKPENEVSCQESETGRHEPESVDTTAENKPNDEINKTAETEPLFAPEPATHTIESVSEPVMAGIEDKTYGGLFDEKPETPIDSKQSIDTVEPQIETAEEESPQELPLPTPSHEDSEDGMNEASDETKTKPDTKAAEAPAPEPSLFDYLQKNTDTKPTQTIGDKFGQDRPSVVDHISQKVATQKVSDLRTVININDKFSFVGALFHNNMRAYTDFILRLNAIDDRSEAMAFVSETAQQYNWNMDSIEVKTFNKILDRKF